MNSDNSAERGASRNAVTFGLALVGIVIGVVAGRSITDTRRSLVEVGDPTFGLAEDFSHLPISATDGFESTLGDFAAGRPVVMTIRDAYCPVSRRYGPKTGRFSHDYGDRGVRFVHVNVSPLDTPQDMAREVEEYGLAGPYVADHEWKLAGALRVISTGEVFVFDGSGRLRYRGAIDDQYGIRFSKPEPRETFLADALDAVLVGREVAVASTPPEGCYLAPDVHEIEHHHGG